MALKQKDLTDTEAAWLAGFIDGEGCIADKPSNTYIRPGVKLTLVQKYPAPLEYAQLITNSGNLRQSRIHGRWRWTIVLPTEFQRIITSVIPYLRTNKLVQAHAGLRLAEMAIEHRYIRNLSLEVQTEVLALNQVIRDAKKEN